MFGLGKALGSLMGKAKKVENRDLMEAIVGGGLLVAYADGSLEKEEQQKLDQLIRSNDNLAHFGNEISKTIGKFSGLLDADFGVGKMKILREIRDVANNSNDAEEVMVNVIAIAKADGEIEPDELKVLQTLARELGQRLSDYGIEA